MKRALASGLGGTILLCVLALAPASAQTKATGATEKSSVAAERKSVQRANSAAKSKAVSKATRETTRSASRTKEAPATKLSARKSSPKKTAARKSSLKKTAARTSSSRNPVQRAAATSTKPATPSMGQAMGLHAASDALDLRSSVALVSDAVTGEILFEKNASAVLPIASISKLMTAIVVLDSKAPLHDMLEITTADVDTERGTRSRLRAGTRLSRSELLQLALMSSENRAANALGRHHPQGYRAFITAMNDKARGLGMLDTTFVEPTGLSSANASTARDLAQLVRSAAAYPLIREYSTATDLTVDTGYRQHAFRNTNRLIASERWDIELQKTGYISEAGRCLVMQVRLDGRQTVLVLLDSAGRQSRFGDAQRVRVWLESTERRAPARTISSVPESSAPST